MSMKKLISFALCLVIALAFAAGCKKKEEAMAPAPEAAAPEAMAPMSSAAAPAAEAPAAEAPAAEAPAAK